MCSILNRLLTHSSPQICRCSPLHLYEEVGPTYASCRSLIFAATTRVLQMAWSQAMQVLTPFQSLSMASLCSQPSGLLSARHLLTLTKTLNGLHVAITTCVQFWREKKSRHSVDLKYSQHLSSLWSLGTMVSMEAATTKTTTTRPLFRNTQHNHSENQTCNVVHWTLDCRAYCTLASVVIALWYA